MAHVFVVHAGHGGTFVFGAQVFFVMIHHHIHAVRVVAGHDHQHRLRKPLFDPFVLRCDQAVNDERRGLRRSHLVGVHGHGQQDEHLPLPDKIVYLIRA